MQPKRRVPLSAEMLELINRRSAVVGTTVCTMDSLQPAENENKAHVATRLSQLQHELLTSEMEYLKQLEKVQTFFMEPLMASRLLDDEQFHEIFGHLQTIYMINGELVHEIKDNMNNILNAFNTMAPHFKLYSAYATQYRFCLASLNSAVQCNKHFAKFLHDQETRPEVQCKLSSLLIVPIQRIPRYALMIQQLLAISSKTCDNYPLLQEAYNKIVETTRHLDAMVEEHENFEKVLEISCAVKDGKPLVIKPGRKLIKHGVLLSNETNKMRERYVILFTDILMKCQIKKKTDALHQPGSLKCELILPLHKCSILPNSQKAIAISCENIKLLLDCESKHEKLKWFEEIKNAIYSDCGNRSTLHKRHSERRPASGCDLDMYRDFGVSPGHKLRKRRSRLPAEEVGTDAKEKSIKRRHSVSGLEHEERSERGASPSLNVKDSLFPLREHVLHVAEQKRRKMTQPTLFKRCEFKPFLLRKRKSIHSSVETPQDSTDAFATSEEVPEDIYVFGTPCSNNHRFSFGRILSRAAGNFKKLFGFR